MDEPLCTSLIYLIPKGEDKFVLKNRRPITLLGTIYKILVKTLAFRMRLLLPDIIRESLRMPLFRIGAFWTMSFVLGRLRIVHRESIEYSSINS